MGYNILADVIHKVSGKIFKDYIQENIQKSLGMNKSTFLKSEIISKYATSPHVLIEKENNKFLEVNDLYPYNRIHAPNGTLHSNVEDMCNWLIAWLNMGE